MSIREVNSSTKQDDLEDENAFAPKKKKRVENQSNKVTKSELIKEWLVEEKVYSTCYDLYQLY